MIEIIDLEKSFGGQSVLRGVNLKIGAGEVTAILGKSGGGKSVLLKHIIGLMKPDKGRILINGTDITGLGIHDMDKVREKFAVVFQFGALFDSMTVFENVAFPVVEKKRISMHDMSERVMLMLEEVGLVGMEGKYPSEISGGMRKRAALARALIMEPEIILFDEPTTGLDPILLDQIHSYIKATHSKYGFTGIVISHEVPEIFDIADRVAVLDGGVIIETGTPADIRKSSNPVVRRFVAPRAVEAAS
ncbi:MAG TPA: ATP-binding cassette domain-containing protein [Dissulfurispiraceae bacterium]|nr:ATP-binding cassette domain-containing protein [Dissulfurispiraceae bacterium]